MTKEQRIKNLGKYIEKGNIPWNKGIKNPGVGGRPKGGTPWNKGKTGVYSQKTIDRMVEGRKKHTISEETRKKLREARLGVKVREETKNKVREANLGSKSHFWKGGISTENEMARVTVEMKLWKKAVLVRDNFTCQKTGISGCELHVHHINNFSSFLELRTSIENGITLSKKSHLEFHHIYGNKNNTREQIEEYLKN